MEKISFPPKVILLIGVLGASFSSVFVKYSIAPPLITATYRLVFSVLLMAPYFFWKNRGELKGLERKDYLLCGLSGAFLAGHFVFWFDSLRYTSIASSTLLVSLEVIFTAMGAVWFLKEKIPKIGIYSIGVTFLGSVMIAISDKGTGQNALFGDCLAVAGAFFVAVYTLLGRVERKRVSTGLYTFLVYVSCSLVLLICDGLTKTPVMGYGMWEIVIGLCLAVFCTLMGHTIFSWSLKYLSSAYVAAAKLCEPVFAAACGLVLFQEVPTWLQILGSVVILCGVYTYSKAEQGLERE